MRVGPPAAISCTPWTPQAEDERRRKCMPRRAHDLQEHGRGVGEKVAQQDTRGDCKHEEVVRPALARRKGRWGIGTPLLWASPRPVICANQGRLHVHYNYVCVSAHALHVHRRGKILSVADTFDDIILEKTEVQCVCRGCAAHMQCTCSAHAVHMQCTCSAHSELCSACAASAPLTATLSFCRRGRWRRRHVARARAPTLVKL